MALPAGVTTCEIRFGSPASGFTGEPVSVSISVQPTATLIWAATGQPVIDFLIPRDVAEGESGVLELPHVDQAGFRDTAGNQITGWSYTITGTYKSESQSKPFRKVVAPVVGQAFLDVDLVPAAAPVTSPVVVPAVGVTSLAGLTGAITEDQLRELDRIHVGPTPPEDTSKVWVPTPA